MPDTTDLTIYYVGYTPQEAREGLPFDSHESAQSYADDEGGKIYSATAYVYWDTLEEVD